MDIEKQGPAVNLINASQGAIEAELSALGVDIDAEPGDVSAAELSAAVSDDDRDRYAKRLSGMLTMPVLSLFAVFAPAWRVTVDESGRLAFVWSRVLAKYLPVSWLHYIPDGEGSGGCVECDAIAVTLEVVGPRMVRDNSEAEPERQPERWPETARTTQQAGDTMPDVFGAAQ